MQSAPHRPHQPGGLCTRRATPPSVNQSNSCRYPSFRRLVDFDDTHRRPYVQGNQAHTAPAGCYEHAHTLAITHHRPKEAKHLPKFVLAAHLTLLSVLSWDVLSRELV